MNEKPISDPLEEISLTEEEINLFFLAAFVAVGPIYDKDFYRPAKQNRFIEFRRDWWKGDPRIDWLEATVNSPGEELAPYGLPTWHPLSIPEYEKWLDHKEGVNRE